jgi:excisionase family DNA binding protein
MRVRIGRAAHDRKHLPVKPKEKLLKSRDVAWILDWSPDDVNVLARKGELKAFKQGRNWRFREADVVAYKKRMEKLRGKES